MAGAVAVSSQWGSASSGGAAAVATQAASSATMGGAVGQAAALRVPGVKGTISYWGIDPWWGLLCNHGGGCMNSMVEMELWEPE